MIGETSRSHGFDRGALVTPAGERSLLSRIGKTLMIMSATLDHCGRCLRGRSMPTLKRYIGKFRGEAVDTDSGTIIFTRPIPKGSLAGIMAVVRGL